MHNTAKRLQQLHPSPTLTISAHAKTLAASGRPIINLTAGEPDFPVPHFIIDAMKEALEEGHTQYTPVGGMPLLKKAIQEKFRRDNGVHFDPSEILVSAGAKQSIFNALMATVNPGDEVVIPIPYWPSYLDMTYLCEGIPICVKATADMKMSASDLEAALTPRTKWVILNSPSNPGGICYTHQELDMFASVVRNHPQVWVLSDDIYEPIRYTTESFATLVAIAPDLRERILTVNGVSKAYAMTGLRIGYAAGPKDLIREMENIQSHATSNPNSIAQIGAAAALNGPQTFLNEWRDAFEERAELVYSWMNRIPGLSCQKPAGAFYAYVSAQGLIGRITPDQKILKSDVDIVTYLLDAANVALVPGSAFGLSPFFRLSYAVSHAMLEKGCQAISEAVLKLLPNEAAS